MNLKLMNTRQKLKNSIWSFNSRLNHAEVRTSKLEGKSFEISELREQQKRRMKKSEESP